MPEQPIRNTFVYLIGFAGTGKLTIARAFVRHVDAIVVDNHWINNPIFGLIDPDGKSALPEAVWTQVWRVHEAVMETVATLAKPGRNFVFTHDGIEGEPYDRKKFEAIRSAAERRQALLVPVRLVCEAEELARRIESPGRAEKFKSTNARHAIRRAGRDTVLDPRTPETLTLDVTRLSPEESAAAIVAHIRGVSFPQAGG
jgi:predicted kinase